MGRGGNAKAARLERAFSLPGLTGNIPSAEPSQQEHPLMLPDAENKLMVARGGRGGGAGRKGQGVKQHTLAVTKQSWRRGGQHRERSQ